MANKVTTTGQTTFTAKVRTTGQTTFVKKIVIGTPVRSVTETGTVLSALADVGISNISDNQIIVFDSGQQKFINTDSATLSNITLSGNVKSNLVPSQDSTFDLGDSSLKWKDLYLSGGTIHLGGLDLKDSGTELSVTDSVGNPVNFSLLGSRPQIRDMFSAGGDLSYNSSSGEFSFDVEQVYTKANFDSDFNIALDSAALEGVGLTYNNATNTLAIDSSELYSLFKHDDFLDFVADEHIAHSGVTITAGAGLTGGGTIASSRTINVVGGKGIISNANDIQVDSANIKGIFSGSNSITYNSGTGDIRAPQPLDSTASPTFNDITRTATVDSATYGSATQIPVLTVNTSGFIDSIGTISVAGVASTSFDSSTGIFTINTADGNSFTTHIQDSADLEKISRASLSGGTGITYNSSTGVITTTDGEIEHDNLSGFIPNEHVNHNQVSVIAGTGLTGGGKITANKTLNVIGGKGITANANDIQIDSANIDNIIDSALTEVSVIAGKGLLGGGTIVSDRTIDIDSANVKGMFSGGTGITYNSGTGAISTTDGDIVHDDLSGFVADEHIAHSGVEITAGTGLTGGGTIASTRTLNVIGGKGIVSNANDIQVDSDNIRKIFSGGTGVSYNNANGEFSIGQAVGTSDNVTFNQVRGPAEFIIDPAAIGDATGTVKIMGNLQVEGTQTTINSTAVSINDKAIVIADSAADSSALNNGGLIFGGSSIVGKPSFKYNHAGAKFIFNRPFEGQYLGFDSDFDSALSTSSSTQTIRGYVSGGTGITYNSTSGAISTTDGEIEHDNLSGFVANEHIDHTSVSVTAGTGLTGGGTIASTRTLNVVGGKGIIANANDVQIDSANVRAMFSGGTGITYNSGTGAFTTTDGDIVHDDLSGFVGNEHIDHSGVSIVAGKGLSGGGTIASSRTIDIDSSNVRSMFSGGTGITYNSGTGAITTTDGDIVHDDLSGFVADEHIAHSGVSITAGTGLTGGGTIAANRTINVVGGKGIIANANDIQIDSSNIQSILDSNFTNKITITNSGTIGLLSSNVASAAYLKITDGTNTLGFDGNEITQSTSGNPGQLHIAANQILLRPGNSATDFVAQFNATGTTKLYHNKIQKFMTTDSGVTVTGSLITDSATTNNIDLTNRLYFDSAGNTARVYLTRNDKGNQVADTLKIQTVGGLLNIGPQNTGFNHFSTDRAKHYFNRKLIVDESIISGYDENTFQFYLRNASDLRLRLGDSEGVLFVQSPGLGTSLGDSITLGEFRNTSNPIGGNASKLQIRSIRDGAGSDWTKTQTRIQQTTDITKQGYIQFNGEGNNYGIELGTIDDEKFIQMIRNGAVELYHNDNKKLETTSSGATVTGTLAATLSTAAQANITSVGNLTALRVDGEIDARGGITDNDGPLILQAKTGEPVRLRNHSGNNIITVSDAGVAKLNYTSTGTKLETTAYGATVTGTINADSATIGRRIKATNALISVNNDDSSKFSTLTVGERMNNDGIASISLNPAESTLSAKLDGAGTYAGIWTSKNSTNAYRFLTNFGTADETVQLRPLGTTRIEANKYGATVTGTMNADSSTLTNLTITGSAQSSLNFTGGSFADVMDLNNNGIRGVNRIIFEDAGPNEGLQWGNIKLYESPNNLTTNSNGNLQIVHGSTRRFTVSDSGAEVVGRLFTTDSAIIDGNGSTSGVGIGDGKIEMRTATGIPAYVDFYCETNNAHRVRLQSPAHANYGGNPDVILPTSSGTLALTSQIPSSGISSGNVATFTSGVADNDFLRVDGTSIEGREASQVLTDIAAMPLAGGTFAGNVKFNDNVQAQFGTGSDFNIRFNETNTVLGATAGNISIQPHATGNVNIYSGSQFIMQADHTNVRLYSGGASKFLTDAYGATINGRLDADSATITGMTRTSGLFSNGSIGNSQSAKGVYAGLSTAGDAQLALVGDNTDVSPQIDLAHDVSIDYDARLILENTGNTLAFKSHGNENTAKFRADGAVELFYDNAQKFETTDSGINIFGKIRINNVNLTKTSNSPILDSAAIPLLQLPASAIGTGVLDSDRLPLGTFGGGGGGAAGSIAADDISTGDAAVTISTNTGNITIDAQEGDTDIIFKGTDGTSDTTFLTLDGSDAGTAIFNHNITMVDNAYINIGSGNGGIDGQGDLRLRSNGTHGYVEHMHTGSLILKGDTLSFRNRADDEQLAKFLNGGAVELYHNNSKKIETTATGVSVTGLLSATTKSFVIDHPTKEGMKLRHGSLEGPENGVYVRGRLKGRHVIELPDYWPGLVDEETITVSLTPVGNHQGLYVESIENNMVFVGGESNSRIDCFYTVYGERKDVEKMTVEY